MKLSKHVKNKCLESSYVELGVASQVLEMVKENHFGHDLATRSSREKRSKKNG